MTNSQQKNASVPHTRGDEPGDIANLVFKYGEGEAGPNQLTSRVTSSGVNQFEYNEIGQMKQYNGFNLTFDVEGRLVRAHKPGSSTIKYHYDDTGVRKLTIIERDGKTKVHQHVFDTYQVRDKKQTWFVTGGEGKVEISEARGLEIDGFLFDELTAYVNDPENHKKPLPVEYMDLDGDGDTNFDADDLAVAEEGYVNSRAVGQDALVWRYYHRDHLGGSTIVTDSIGDVVSTTGYHPYGKTASRSGQQPMHGFAGGEIEDEEELGLIQFGARWYALEIAVWISADPLFLVNPKKNLESPLESGLYSYALRNPVNKTDPDGLQGTEGRGASSYSSTPRQLDPNPYHESISSSGSNIQPHLRGALGGGGLVAGRGFISDSGLLARNDLDIPGKPWQVGRSINPAHSTESALPQTVGNTTLRLGKGCELAATIGNVLGDSAYYTGIAAGFLWIGAGVTAAIGAVPATILLVQAASVMTKGAFVLGAGSTGAHLTDYMMGGSPREFIKSSAGLTIGAGVGKFVGTTGPKLVGPYLDPADAVTGYIAGESFDRFYNTYWPTD